MTQVRLRVARADAVDEEFLWRMLVEAAWWRPGGPKLSMSQAVGNRAHARYVASWGRDGDSGMIAEAAGAPASAAWWRFFTWEDHGYGFIEPAVPEVSIAVAEVIRGQGVGTALLAALIERAGHENVRALSLSVEVDNPAVRLYQRLGFTRTGRAGNASTMRLDTRSA